MLHSSSSYFAHEPRFWTHGVGSLPFDTIFELDEGPLSCNFTIHSNIDTCALPGKSRGTLRHIPTSRRRGDPLCVWREALWPLSSRPEGLWELPPLLPSDCAPAAEDVDASDGGLVAWRNHGWSWGKTWREPPELAVVCCGLNGGWSMTGWQLQLVSGYCIWRYDSVLSIEICWRFSDLEPHGLIWDWWGWEKPPMALNMRRSSPAAAILMWLGTRLQSGKPTPN